MVCSRIGLPPSDYMLNSLGRKRVCLWGALPGPASAPGGPRTHNFYIGGRGATAGADINRIADQLADMLEREQTYARD
jgi:hypothetical protein